MTPLAPDQWVLLLLTFLLGLFLGMYFLAGGKWKRRYREQEALHRDELRRRDALETERRRLDATHGTVTTHDERIVADDTRPVARRRWWRP